MLYFTAACMTWELAESGQNFITTVINGADLVPTFSAASVDDLRSEVLISTSFANSKGHRLIQDLYDSSFSKNSLKT